jgi:hypothetical protein
MYESYLSTVLLQVGERIFNLEQVELAFKCLAGGGHKGKIVIRLDSSSPDTSQLIARR